MEIVDIPSDAESVNGLVDSNVKKVEVDVRQVGDEDASDNDIDEDKGNCFGGEVWAKKGKQRADRFTADFGSNISDNIKSPLDIFLCLFPGDILDLIVQRTNIYIQKKTQNEQLITRDKLLIFLGINILMEIKKISFIP